MYRYLFRTITATRTQACYNIYEACSLPATCDKAARHVFSIVKRSGLNGISTSATSYCEKKDGHLPPTQDGIINASKDGSPIETTVVEEKVDAEKDQLSEHQVEMSVFKTDGSSKPREDAAKKLDVDGPKKSGKASLLDLLGAMKVEVTNKRKLKFLKAQQIQETEHKSKSAVMPSTISMFQKATVEASGKSESLNPQLVAAASAAASTLSDPSQAESELLRQLREHDVVSEAQKKGEINNIGVIIANMKVGKRPNRQNARPANQIRFDEDGLGYTNERGITSELDGVRRRRNLFSGKRLGIFSPTTEQDGVDVTIGVDRKIARPTLWDIDFANQLVTSTNQIPRNGFDEMIQWTREGKLWQYPINNEAGMEEEACVQFHEHVFLEKYLEEGFPQQGSIRHFMELVVAGLAKNPYLTVRQKKEHISWFNNYFQQKEDIMNEADVSLN